MPSYMAFNILQYSNKLVVCQINFIYFTPSNNSFHLQLLICDIVQFFIHNNIFCIYFVNKKYLMFGEEIIKKIYVFINLTALK